ncbi:DPP IV N-terminal domain-containing protein [Bacteroidota bacterium]
MKKFNLIIIVMLVISSQAFPQNRTFTVEEVVIDSYDKLAPGKFKQIQWITGTYEYSFILNSDEGEVLVKNRSDSGKITIITTLKDLNVELEDLDLKKEDTFPVITWYSNSNFYFWSDNSLLSFDANKKELSLINHFNDKGKYKQLAPNNKYVAFSLANNLYLATDTDDIDQITFDTNPAIVNGHPAHRNEFGIKKGIFWSPNSNYIAFYKMDRSMVTDYPIVDFTTVPATATNIKYPMAGQASQEVKIAIYNLETEETIFLETDKPEDHYSTNISWDPSEKYLYVAQLNRDQTHLRFIKYEVETGDEENILFEEENEKYVEPQTGAFFLPEKPNEFIWLTRRDGYNHLYHYNTEGDLLKKVTSGNWEVVKFIGFDPECEKLFFTSNKDEIPGRQLYSVELTSGDMTKLTRKEGIHKISMCSSRDYFIDQYNSLTVPSAINIIDEKGEIHRVLEQAENPIKDYAIGNTKIFTIKGDNNFDLYCRMTTPPNFNESKKYPVIVYVYGGPHSQGVLNSWPRGKYDFWFLMMAQKGYIIFELDNRGTNHRGAEFEQTTFRKLGTIEIEDQMRGVNYLKRLSYVDSDRFGVYGWSYGGFMAVSLLLRTNNTFKAAVGGGTVVDWKFYEVMYTERYMDTPQTNPKGYEESSLINYVDNLKGSLLLVHGTSDPTVLLQNSLAFCKKAVTLNKQLEYFPYVGHKHGVSDRDKIHLYTKITNFFLNNL